MKTQESVSANRRASVRTKIHRFAPALAPLRCAHPDEISSEKEKRKQTRSVRLTKLKPYQRPSSATAAGERRWSAGAITKSPATRKRKARRLFAAALWLGDDVRKF